MKCAVTGHTKGIGKEIFDYFSKRSIVWGFSKSTGFDISNPAHRAKILDEVKNFDIFVNNAYNDYDNSQLLMLELIADKWRGTDKMIINISSRYTYSSSPYSTTKLAMDEFCLSRQHELPYILNLKPGMVDTPRAKNLEGDRMQPSSVVDVINFVLYHRDTFKTHCITFGK